MGIGDGTELPFGEIRNILEGKVFGMHVVVWE